MTQQQADDARKRADPLIGQRLVGNYEVLDILGAGGMAIVYKAKQIKMDRIVALKTLKSKELDVMARFAREMQTLAKLKHRNIVDAIDCIETPDGQSFLVMEYVEGITLLDLLKTVGKVEKEDDLAKILMQICDALEHAHQSGIIHRDLKPANIILIELDGDVLIKVLDFGIAKIQDDMQKLTAQGQALGSPLYMSPEACMGQKLTPASDVYSLGVLAYELISGNVPYAYQSMAKVMASHCTPDIYPESLMVARPDLPGIQQLDQIIMRTLETDLDKRFPTVTDFKKAIAFWIQSVKAGQGERPLPKEMKFAPTVQPKKKDLTASMHDMIAMKKKGQQATTHINRASVAQTPPSGTSIKMLLFGVMAVCLTILVAGAIIINFDQVQEMWVKASRQMSTSLMGNPATKQTPNQNEVSKTPEQPTPEREKPVPDKEANPSEIQVIDENTKVPERDPIREITPTPEESGNLRRL